MSLFKLLTMLSVLVVLLSSCQQTSSGSGTYHSVWYAGNYGGTFTGDIDGTWEMNADESGNLSGFFLDNTMKYPLSGKVQKDGSFIGIMDISIYLKINFSGTMNKSTGEVSGIWKNETINKRGTFTGKRDSNIRIIFDELTIECFKDGTEVQSWAKLSEGERLSFYAKDLPDGKMVDTWAIGKTVKKGSYQFYQVKKSDADYSGVIRISYTLKDATKFRIIFDETKVEARKNGFGNITSGIEVYEEENIYFSVKTPSLNKVAVWSINNKPVLNHQISDLSYRIKAKDADTEKKIEISYTERDPIELTIQFDHSKIKCTKNGEFVLSNSKHLEGTSLNFETLNGKFVKWKIGRVTYMNKAPKRNIVLHKNYIYQDDVLVISYEE